MSMTLKDEEHTAVAVYKWREHEHYTQTCINEWIAHHLPLETTAHYIWHIYNKVEVEQKCILLFNSQLRNESETLPQIWGMTSNWN